MSDMIQSPRLTQECSRVANAVIVWPSWRADYEEVFCHDRNLPFGKLVQKFKFYNDIDFQNDLFITKSIKYIIFSTGQIFSWC
jgi:hypothetical protein